MDVGLVIDYMRPGALYKSYGTYQELSDTWEDPTIIPTEQEMIDAEPAALLAQIDNEATTNIDGNKLIKLIAIVFFDHENRTRVLEGKAEIDMPTFKQALIDRYKLI